MLTFIDLCCGMGSFHYSFAAAGMKCVMAADIDPVARATQEANQGMKPEGDLQEVDIAAVPPFDILCAGFPCQPFSNAGFHRGFHDTRGILFFRIMEFVNHHKPKQVVLENVPAIVKHDQGNTLRVLRETLEAAGYTVAHTCIKCSDQGIPQMRKRFLLVAVKDGDPAPLLKFDTFRKTVSLADYLGKPFEKTTAYTIRCGGRHSPILDRHNWDGYWVDGKEQRLTIADALRLQGFPDNFILEGSESAKWHQLGNTIPTVFTRMIAENLIREEAS